MAGVSKRRKAAFAKAAAAKQRRQKILVIAGAVLLVLILAYEIPHTLKLLKSAPTYVPAATPTPVVPGAAASAAHAAAALRALRRHTPVDMFAVSQVQAGVPAYGVVATPPGLRDPFASSAVAATPTAPPPTTTTPSPPVQLLPKQIVIGTPGPGRVASHGWILILASIPTAQGRTSATATATKARKRGLDSVSILNSSNRRPLRGGYWVVYTGPYPSLAAVNSASTRVHASGFSDAYIRQLIVYKAK